MRMNVPVRARLLRLLIAAGAGALLSACGTITLPGGPVAAESAAANTSSGNYLAGVVAGYRRDTDAAARFYGRALEGDPGNAAILERAFLLEVSTGNIERAARLGETVQESDPDSPLARVALTVESLKKHNYKEADERIGGAEGDADSDVVWISLKAWTLAGLGRFDDALAIMRSPKTRAHVGAFGLFQEALLLDFAGRTREAEAAYSKATVAFEGSSIRVLEAYGRYLERSGRPRDAVRLYDAYLETVPDHPVVLAAKARAGAARPKVPSAFVETATDGAAEAMLAIGLALSSQRAIDLPIIYTQMSLYLRPDSEVALALLADLYEQSGQPDLAIATYERIAPSSPLAGVSVTRIARNLAALNRTDEAIERVSRRLRRDGEDRDLLVTLGDLERQKENWNEAASAYRRALALSVRPGKDDWPILYSLGISLERAKRWDEAEPMFKAALALEPDQPQVLNYLGYSWIDRGENLKEGLAMIKQAVAQRPGDGYIIDSLGWAHYRLGDYHTAVKHLEEAVELRPTDPTINDHLGDAYWMVGRRREAKFQWSHALEGNPPPTKEEADAIRRKLESGLEAPVGPASGAGS